MSSSSTVTRAVIAFIVTVALADTAYAATASCKGAAQHLVTLIRHDWPSSDANMPAATGDMIGLIVRKSPGGVVPGTTRFALTYSRQEFIKRAGRLKPPFTPSSELLNALDDLDGNLVVVGLPGTNMLAANSIGGTAHCNSTVLFSTSNGRSRLLQGPEGWKDDAGGSCGLTRSFASIDGAPFVIDDSLDSGPGLTSTLTLTPWVDGKWMDPCRADFVFAPHFDDRNLLNDWSSLNNWDKNDCGTEDCEGFRRAALNVVKQAQLDPAGVEARLLAAMTVPQRVEYRRLKRIADRPDPADPQAGGSAAENAKAAAGLTDTKPLPLPMVVDNQVFLATVGHFTVGWRVFADWKVTVQAGDGDKTKEIAHFAIGMTKGPIVGATVK